MAHSIIKIFELFGVGDFVSVFTGATT